MPPLAAKERARFPENLERIPEPRLQPSEIHDLSVLRKKEERILTGYQWVDEKKGVVSVPIDRAIELLSTGDKAGSRGIRVRAGPGDGGRGDKKKKQ